MKSIKIAALLAVAVSSAFIFNACCKKNASNPTSQILKFDVPFQDTGSLPIIPALPIELPAQDSMFSYQVPTYADSLFKQNNSSPGKIISVKAKSVKMSLFDQTKKIDFIKSVKVFVANKDGSNKVLMGFKNPIDSNASNVDLDLTGEELKSYITADTFRIIIGGQNRAGKGIGPGTTLKFDAIFGCEANP